MANIARIELGDTTYEDDSIRSAIEAITDYDEDGNIYVNTDSLKVTNNITANHDIYCANNNIDRDGSNPSNTVWTTGMGMLDKDGEWITFLQGGQTADGTSIGRIRTMAENSSGTELQNYIAIKVDKNGAKSYEVGDPSAFRTAIDAATADHTHSYLPLSGGTLTGNVFMNAVNRGYYLKDSAGHNYPGIYNNGENLWIGSTATASTHHIGETYISAGYNKTNGKGNPTIIVSVPNAANNGGTNYGVYHTGYKPTPADIGAQPAGSYATTNASGAINTLASTNTQQWRVMGTVSNSSNTARNGHTTWLVITNTGLNNWDGTSGANIWSAYTTASPQPASAWSTTKTTTVSSVITAASGITIDSVTYAEWGKLAMLSVTCKGFANSTGSKSVGTVLSGKRPVHNVYATNVSSGYAAYAQLTTGGALTVYWATAPTTATSYTIRFVYILA